MAAQVGFSSLAPIQLEAGPAEDHVAAVAEAAQQEQLQRLCVAEDDE